MQKTAGRDLGRGGLTVPAGPSTAILSWLGTRRSAVRLDLPANGAAISRVMSGLRSGGSAAVGNRFINKKDSFRRSRPFLNNVEPTKNRPDL